MKEICGNAGNQQFVNRGIILGNRTNMLLNIDRNLDNELRKDELFL